MNTKTTIFNYTFPDEIVSYNNSFLNDIVLDEQRNIAYLTDAMADGGIIVYDANKQTSRVFSGSSTEADSSYNFCVNGKCYGRRVFTTPTDGIALSPSGDILYWSDVQGPMLYAVRTEYLRDFSLSNAFIESKVSFLGDKKGCSDGLLMLGDSLYYGDITNSNVYVISPTVTASVDDMLDPKNSVALGGDDVETLHWVDTFSVDPNDTSVFYLTSNKLDYWSLNSMDFTGTDGANFRVMKVQISL